MKIEQNYSGPTVYVQNASRTVGVVSALLSDTQRDELSPARAKSMKRCVSSMGVKTAYAAGDPCRRAGKRSGL
nr:hypothetical protein [Klebsiella pneumoniae subsp. pneumoniae]